MSEEFLISNTDNQPTKKQKILKRLSIITIVVCSVLTIILSYLIGMKITFYNTYAISTVSQYSMLPEVNLNQYLMYGEGYYADTSITDYKTDWVFIRKTTDVKRGDIISAEVEWNSKGILKRLIGLGGDKIRIVPLDAENQECYDLDIVQGFNLVVIPKGEEAEQTIYYMPLHRYLGKNKNGEDEYLHTIRNYNLFQSFVNNPEKAENVYTNPQTLKQYILLKDDEVFFMGDNWQSSLDCLEKDPAKATSIQGRVDAIIPYGNNLRFSAFKFYSTMLFKYF